MLPAEPLLASNSSAVPAVNSAEAELFGMPEAAVPLDALPAVALEFGDEPDPFALVELEAGALVAGGGLIGAKVVFVLPKPRAAA